MARRPDPDPLAGWTIDREETERHGSAPRTLLFPGPSLRLRKRFEPPQAPEWMRIDLVYPPVGLIDARLAFRFADGTRLPWRLTRTGRNRFQGLFQPPLPLAEIELHIQGSGRPEAPDVLRISPISAWSRRLALLRRGLDVLRGDPRSFPWRLARFALQVKRQGRTTIPTSAPALRPAEAYRLWQERFDERDEEGALHSVAPAAACPHFTVIADPEARDVAALQASLERQVYPHWDLVVPQAGRDRTARLAAALDGSRGDFILLPSPGTVLRPHALAVFAGVIARHPEAALVHADDDDLGDDGVRSDPRFKPAWSPTRIIAFDYVGDPCCLGTSLVRESGGIGASRHDLLARLAGRLRNEEAIHIAQVLSHRRKGAERPSDAGAVPSRPTPRLDDKPLVSLVVPTRDRADLLRLSVGSIRRLTAYPAYEIVIVDNGSTETETLRLFESWRDDPTIRVLRDPSPFNYAALNNRAVREARGVVVGLVNNDVEALHPDWLDEMAAWAMEPGIGCVGAKLHYPDGRLQHGGVVTGIAGAAGHRRKRAARGERGMLDELVTVGEVSAVTAACLLVRKSIYEEVGGLDETTFAVAYNDVDFCLKVRAAGYRNLWTPFAELNHHESVSRGRDLTAARAQRFDRENFALRLRWGDDLLDDPYYSPNLTVDAESGVIRTQ